jgi:hypothetical protein
VHRARLGKRKRKRDEINATLGAPSIRRYTILKVLTKVWGDDERSGLLDATGKGRRH